VANSAGYTNDLGMLYMAAGGSDVSCHILVTASTGKCSRTPGRLAIGCWSPYTTSSLDRTVAIDVGTLTISSTWCQGSGTADCCKSTGRCFVGSYSTQN
jgi:hypothetical protein